MRSNIPVVLLGFKRPQALFNQLQNLKQLKLKNVYVIIDGTDQVTQEIFSLIFNWFKLNPDFKPEIHITFREKNLGLNQNMIKSLNKVFKMHRNAIILEDDVIFNQQSLYFMIYIIKHFSRETDFGAVSVFSPLSGKLAIFKKKKTIYYRKNIYFPCWGWATTRKVWKQHIDRLENQNLISLNIFGTPSLHRMAKKRKLIWNGRFYKAKLFPNRTWDIPFQESLFINNLKVWMPLFTMSSNIGFRDSKATNTKVKKPWWVPKNIMKGSQTFQFQIIENKFINITLNHLSSISFAADSSLLMCYSKLRSHIRVLLNRTRYHKSYLVSKD